MEDEPARVNAFGNHLLPMVRIDRRAVYLFRSSGQIPRSFIADCQKDYYKIQRMRQRSYTEHILATFSFSSSKSL